MTKVCTACKTEKPLTEYRMSFNRQRNKSYPTGKCRPCLNEYKRTHQTASEKADARRARYASDPEYRRYKLSVMHKHKYGITLDEKDAMLAAQGGVCALCGTDDPTSNGWATDHDHACCSGGRSCGKCIRGIICSRCNCGLGQFDDDIAKLQSAIDYLNHHRAQ